MGKRAFITLCIAMTTLAISNKLLAQSPTISYSQTTSYAGIEDYLKTNILDLNSIEGIWSVEFSVIQSSFLYSEPLVEKTPVELAIVNTSTGYKSLLVIAAEKQLAKYELNKIAALAFRQIGESSNYYCKVVSWGCAHKYSEKVRLTGNSFAFTYSVTDESEKNCMFDRSPGSAVKIQVNITGEKLYPTQSMIVQAVQQRQEEALRKAAEEEAQRIANEKREWSGTGFAIGNGFLVTNNHVVDGANTITIKGVKGDMNNGYSAEVVATDKANDIAIIKINDANFNGFGTLTYAVQQRMADVGEDVFVLGFPLTQALGNEIKLTNGIVSSRTGYQGDVSTYQMSAPVQPGNSGGPMFDSKGNVIGIVVAGVPGAENVGYAIKTSYLKILIESAGLNIKFPANNTISTLSLAEKVKRVKNFVFYIECSK